MKRRVFVVEDHPLMRRSFVEAILRETDLTVCGQAEDVPGALAGIESSRPDLVLTDLRLKTSAGVDLIRALRESSPTLPIVATTLFDARRAQHLARAAGASAFLAKQDGPDQLVATIRTLLAGSQVSQDQAR